MGKSALDEVCSGEYTIEESLKLFTDENIYLMNKLSKGMDGGTGEIEERISRNEKAMKNLRAKENNSKADLIVSKCGECILLKDVKDGDTILYNNTPGYEDVATFKCQVHKDLKKGASLKAGNSIKGELVISADLGTGDCLMVYLVEKVK